MRIGLVTGEYPPMEGGVGAHCRELARELTAQGHTVHVYTDARALESDPRISLARQRGRWGFWTLRAINRWAEKNRLDVVNLHFQTAAYRMSPFIHWLPDAVSVPLVTTFHDLRFPYLFPKAGRWRDWIVMRLARASEGVVSTNHEDFERLKHLPHAALVPIGSSVRGKLPAGFSRPAWRARLGADEGDFVVAHFGFINHTKGVDVLLAACWTLTKQHVPVKLWLIGGRTGSSDPTNVAYLASIEAQAVRFELGARTAWTGFVSDDEAAACFAACDVVALLYGDGASYRRSSLMAAIAHGAAILTTTPAVDIRAFRDSVNLKIVPPKSFSHAAQTLHELWRDPAQLDRLREGARQLAQEFAWDGIARANVEFFARVMSEARR